MKKVFLISLISISLLSAQPTKIESFIENDSTTHTSEFLEDNPLKITTDTNIPPAHILLRRKISNNNYALFQGKLSKKSGLHLVNFETPKTISRDTILHTKFYKYASFNDKLEIKDVYFSRFGSLYVERNEQISFYYDNEWLTLKTDKQASKANEHLLRKEIFTYKVLGFTGYTISSLILLMGLGFHIDGEHGGALVIDAIGGGSLYFAHYLMKKAKALQTASLLDVRPSFCYSPITNVNHVSFSLNF
jgi:hypothetical protein